MSHFAATRKDLPGVGCYTAAAARVSLRASATYVCGDQSDACPRPLLKLVAAVRDGGPSLFGGESVVTPQPRLLAHPQTTAMSAVALVKRRSGKRYKLTDKIFRAVTNGDASALSKALAHRQARQVLTCGHSIDPEGCTPLLLAARNKRLDLVRQLLDAGCDVNERDFDQKRKGSIIHYAAWGGSIEIVNYLVDVGMSSLDETDVVGNTPLLYAVYGGHQHIVEAFLKAGRSIHETNDKMHSALLQASCGGHTGN